MGAGKEEEVPVPVLRQVLHCTLSFLVATGKREAPFAL